MLHRRGIIVGLIVLLALPLGSCAPLVAELKAARNPPQSAALHEQLSQSIHSFGFSHGIRSVRDDGRQLDTIRVAIPLDSLKRQHITLHHMLFNVARLCARPEHAALAIRIDLHAGDDRDRDYMRGIVAPLVAEAHNVQVVAQHHVANDLVITLSKGAAPPHAAAAAR